MRCAEPVHAMGRVEDELGREGIKHLSDPFAGMFALSRLKTYLLALSVVVMGLQGGMLYRLGMGSAAHVYEVLPSGQVRYVAERELHLRPRPYEAEYVAKHFVELLYGWNSSTVTEDLAEAITLSNEALGAQLREEFASTRFVETVRSRAIRSEVLWDGVEVLEHTGRHSRVGLVGVVNRFGLLQYSGEPLEVQPFSVEVVLQVVAREPKLRRNGLEVVNLVHRGERDDVRGEKRDDH